MIKFNNMNCLLSAIIYYSQLMGNDEYPLMFFNALSVPLKDDIAISEPLIKNFKAYFGMKLKYKDINYNDVNVNEISCYLIDAYYAWWITPYYKKKHYPHLVVARKDKDEHLRVFDSNFNFFNQTVPIDNFAHIVNRRLSITFKDNHTLSKRYFIKKMLKSTYNSNYLIELQDLFENFMDKFEISCLNQEHELPQYVPEIKLLMQIINVRELFNVFAKYVSYNPPCEKLITLYKISDMLYNDWKMLRIYLIKHYLSYSNSTKNNHIRIDDKLAELMLREQELAHLISIYYSYV